MRHGKHQHTLVSTQEHRKALLSNLAAALITHGRIETTLAKAKGLRPFVEKVITLAKKAAVTKKKDEAIHLKRLALTYIRDENAVTELFKNRVKEFAKRDGGYTRIYKIGRRLRDGGEMSLIELVAASDEGRKARSKRTVAKVEAPKAETEDKAPAKAEAEEKAPKAKKPAAKSSKKE